ncbi:MAG TPA: DUF6328 family protein [Stellaceae bacterium]|nr:DUF6328 family protein [Stellaceae bacterium]
MELTKKVKTALDETRILILGAEILLGFQLRGAFSDAFEQLPAQARYLDGLALGLMVIAVGLLITPGPYHRIVEGGEDTGAFHAVVTGIADLALFPFALAFGLDVFLSTEPVFGSVGAIAAGGLTALVALSFWYGMPRARRRTAGQRERAMTETQRDERSATPLHVKIEQMLTEARVILPGAQALFGFQLAIVLTHSFEALSPPSRIVHAISLGLVALAIMLLMAPAAYHRIVFAGEDAEEMHRVGSVLITAATVPLALGLAGDVHVVIGKIAGPVVGAASGGAGFALLAALWYCYPLAAAMRNRRKGAAEYQGRKPPNCPGETRDAAPGGLSRADDVPHG